MQAVFVINSSCCEIAAKRAVCIGEGAAFGHGDAGIAAFEGQRIVAVIGVGEGSGRTILCVELGGAGIVDALQVKFKYKFGFGLSADGQVDLGC